MKIKHITIENYRAIESLDFDCSSGVNVFIGDNGAGKSTILDAIVLLYSWLSAKISSSNGRGRSIKNEDVRSGSDYCFLSIVMEHRGRSASWSLFKGLAPENAREKRTDLSQLVPFVLHLREYNEDERYMFSLYGVNRNVSSIVLDKRLYGKKESVNSPKNANGNTSWKPFFNWYFERENEENRMKARFNVQYHDETLDVVRECLLEVFPGYKNLRVEDHPTRFEIEKDGHDINFERLSDGEKCYITLVLDIARRLSLQSDGLNPILECENVILIDEVDLHLHPSWQLQVVSNLERKFHNCQFFVTSHSPLVLSSLGENDNLVVLRDGGRVDVSDSPYGDNGDYILKRFFGLKVVRNPEVQAVIEDIAAELSKEHPDLGDVEAKLDSLKSRGVQFEESVKMRLQLAQKKRKENEKA